MFQIKEFEQLYNIKISHKDMLEVHNNFFFCFDDYIIFMKKSRRFYKVMASSSCGFEPTFRERVFDCVYYSDDINNSIEMFKSYVSRILVKCRA